MLKKIWRFLHWRYFLLSGHYDKGKYYYILKYGIGDTYLVSAILPYLRENNKKIVLLIEKNNQKFIPSMFDDLIEVREAVNMPYELIAEFGRNFTGQPIVFHSDWVKDISLSSILGYNGFTLIDVYKLMLGLDFEKCPIKPKYEKVLSPALASQLSSYKDLILLCPQANSIATINPGFWISLAEFLREKGFSPVFMNSSDSENFDSISFSLYESIAVCNNIKGVISLRSGFCDLISSSETAKIILYPKIKWYSGSLMQGSSLKAMGISNDQLLELELLNSADNSIIFNQIESFLNG